MKKVDIDEKVGEVKGTTAKKDEFEFGLSLRDVKHIRRCIRMYMNIHPPRDEGDTLQKSVLNKFLKFGRRNYMRRTGEDMKAKMKGKPLICNEEGCKIVNGLTIDHIIPLSSDGTNDKDNLQWLCVPHHNVKNAENRIEIKEKEIEIKEKEIKNLKKLIKRENKKALNNYWKGRVRQVPIGEGV